MPDIFISYSRKDKEFVQKLEEYFKKQGRDVWVDWEDIPLMADWRKEMYIGIEESDNFVYVISPDSVVSKPCNEEIEHALRNNKRLVPVMYRYTSSSTVHPSLRCLNFISFNGDDDFDTAFQKLSQAIDTDLDYLKTHTRLLIRAIEWDKKNRHPSLLMRGKDLDDVERWLMEGIKKQPEPTTLHREYTGVSRQQEKNLQRSFLLSVSTALMVSLVLAVLAVFQWKRAEMVTEGQIKALTGYSRILRSSNKEFEALIEGLRAASQLNKQTVNSMTKTQTEIALQGAVYGVKERNRLLEGNKGEDVIVVSLSPDGQMIATAGWEPKVTLWSTDGSKLKVLDNFEGSITSLSFSPDSQKLTAVTSEGTVISWDKNGVILESFNGPKGELSSISLNKPSAPVIATFDDDNNTVEIWTKGGKTIGKIAGVGGLISSLSFSPDGQTLLTSNGDAGQAIIWSLNGQKLQTFSHSEFVSVARFSPDGKTIITGTKKGKLLLWHRDGKQVPIHPMKQKSQITNVTFSPDGKMIASADDQGTIQLWNHDGWQIQSFLGHDDVVHGLSFSADSRILISAGGDGTARIWGSNPLQPRLLWEHKGKINRISFSQDGKRLASASDDGTVKLWSRDGFLLAELPYHIGKVYSTSFSPDNEWLASGGDDNTVILWNYKTGKKLYQRHKDSINSISFSRDGKLIISASEDGIIKFLNKAGKTQKAIRHSGGVKAVAFSANNEIFASAGQDNTVKVWNTRGQIIATLLGHGNVVLDLAISPDGKIIATAFKDKNVKFWTLEGKLIQTISLASEVIGVAWSKDGQSLATASGEKVEIWSLEGKKLHSLAGHNSAVISVQFSPDGKTLASSDVLGRIILWNLENLAQEQQNLTFNNLIKNGCNWLSDYLKNLSGNESDRSLCEGVSQPK